MSHDIECGTSTQYVNFSYTRIQLKKKIEQALPKNYTKYDIDCHMDFLCHYGNFLDDTSYE